MTVADSDDDYLLHPGKGPERCSWEVLIRHMSVLLLRSMSILPLSSYALSHLKVLNKLLSPTEMSALGANAHTLSQRVTSDLLDHNVYKRLGNVIKSIPIETYSSSPALPLLISLTTAPFSIFAPTSRSYQECLGLLFIHILTIPLDRIPKVSLAEFTSHLPLSLDILSPWIPDIVASASAPESTFNLIKNLCHLTRPLYQKLSHSALDFYLHLLTELIDTLPANQCVEPHTEELLAAITGVDHLTSLLTGLSHRHISTKSRLASFLLSLGAVCPATREDMLNTLLACTGGDLVKELYRGFVRASPWCDYNPEALMYPSFELAWPPLLLLSDLYTHSLLSMGDEVFFSSVPNTSTICNPLTLDELTRLSKGLLNIAFMLSMKDQTYLQKCGTPGIKLRWEGVREKVTKCLQAIHARDSRRPFTPPGHWQVNSKIGMRSFIEASVSEEQQINQPTDSLTLSKGQIASLSPHLVVLNNIPFAIPVEIRMAIFRRFVANDMVSDRHLSGRTRVSVRRGNIAQDAFDKLRVTDIKAPFDITITDQSGQEEISDNIFQEFFTSFCKEMFYSDRRHLWRANTKNELYPNPHSSATEPHCLDWYRFIGLIVGKAIYEGHSVPIQFAGFFLRKWLGKQESFLDDLESLDPDLWSGLIKLKHHTGSLQELNIDFTIAVEESEGVVKTDDLIPNGGNVAVTQENRLQYIQLVSHYRLSKQIKRQSEAFFEGLLEVIDVRPFRMFDQRDMPILLGYDHLPIDLGDLRRHTKYGGEYNDAETTIIAFWKVVDSFDQKERQRLLYFVTNCDKPPLLGFKDLVPNFTIWDAGQDERYLPTVSKCENVLKLPMYKNEQVLRDKLLEAILSDIAYRRSLTTDPSQGI